MTPERYHADSHESGIFTFIAGLFLGAVGGAVAGLILAPKSGEELRQDANKLIQSLPSRVNSELTESNVRTQKFIERARYNIESRVGEFRKGQEASRQAKAKHAEEMASGYDFN